MVVLSLYIICIKVQTRGPFNCCLFEKIVIFHWYKGTDLEWALVKDSGSTTRFLAPGLWMSTLGSSFCLMNYPHWAVLLMDLLMETQASSQSPQSHGDRSESQLCPWKLVSWCRTNKNTKVFVPQWLDQNHALLQKPVSCCGQFKEPQAQICISVF